MELDRQAEVDTPSSPLFFFFFFFRIGAGLHHSYSRATPSSLLLKHQLNLLLNLMIIISLPTISVFAICGYLDCIQFLLLCRMLL